MDLFSLEMKAKRLLSRITIGEPIASTFKPRISIDYSIAADYLIFNITIFTRDSQGPEGAVPEIQVHFQEGLEPLKLMYFLRTEESFFYFVHESLKRMLIHELDEAFRVDGQVIYDPHKGRGTGT